MMKLALTGLFYTCCIAADHASFQSGTLLDVTITDRFFEGTSYRRAVFVVRVGEIVYTANSPRYSGSDLIIGDPIQVAIDKNELILATSNGKRLKLKILKQARVTNR